MLNALLQAEAFVARLLDPPGLGRFRAGRFRLGFAGRFFGRSLTGFFCHICIIQGLGVGTHGAQAGYPILDRRVCTKQGCQTAAPERVGKKQVGSRRILAL